MLHEAVMNPFQSQMEWNDLRPILSSATVEISDAMALAAAWTPEAVAAVRVRATGAMKSPDSHAHLAKHLQYKVSQILNISI